VLVVGTEGDDEDPTPPTEADDEVCENPPPPDVIAVAVVLSFVFDSSHFVLSPCGAPASTEALGFTS